MATREYIGARYVPKFYQNSVDGSTQWQANVVYEPLMWVTLQNSHMYISKKQVPATVGTPAENIDYWLDIGSYNGIIEDLQDQIDAIVGDISDINDDIAEMRTIMKRKFIFFGDSYGFGFLPGGDEQTPDTTGFFKLAAQKIGLAASQYTEVCYGRAGFVAQGVNGKTWVQDLNDLTSDDTVTDIYVMGGLNDIAYVNALSAPIAQFISTAKTKFPNAKIKIGFCGREALNNIFNYTNMLNTINAYKTSTMENGAAYLAGCEDILKGVQGGMASDNYHPSPTGQMMLSWYVINDILGTTPFIVDVPWQGIGVTYDGDVTGGMQIGFAQTRDSIVLCASGLSSITCSVAPGALGNTKIDLGTLNSDAIVGNENGTCLGNVNVLITGDAKNYLCLGQLQIINRKLKLGLTAVDNYVNANPGTVTGIYILPYNVTIPKCLLC